MASSLFGVARSLQRGHDMHLNDVQRQLDDRLPPPFEPTTVLPAQFFTQRERRHARDGIRRLMCAILEDAVAAYVKGANASRPSHTFRQTRRWFGSNDRTWIFSFLRICQALDLDPQYVRRGVRTLSAGGRAH